MVNSITAGNSIDYPIAWSPDGRLMAFSTDEGLWLWDALMADFPPQMLMPTETTVPTARYFSPQGRYLAVTNGTRRYNLDMITNQELPDGYVSPDDRTLLIFDTAADGPTTLEIAYLAPGIRRFDYEAGVEFFEVAWINDVQFLASVTGFGFQRYENVSFEDEDGTIRYEAFPYLVEEPFVAIKQYHSSGIHWVQNELEVPFPVDDPQMRIFHYVEGPGLIELSIDGYHLRINHARDGRFDLTSQLADPIVEAVWLPSVFYYDR
ncbi:hypothetical protein HC928_06655 [bacterium]|nr:hypothetical protein [bacterium]